MIDSALDTKSRRCAGLVEEYAMYSLVEEVRRAVASWRSTFGTASWRK